MIIEPNVVFVTSLSC